MSKSVTAIVTGGGQGIGKAITRRFLQQGINVVIADVDHEAGAETLAEYRDLGPAAFIPCDVADEHQVRHVIDEAVRRFGGLDVLINNAGISRFKPLNETTLADWNAVLGINLTGAFLCSKYAAPHLKNTQGCIINIASTRALMSEPDTEAYAASKGGLVALTHALAISLGPAVRVNCISPGWIEVGDWKKHSERREPQHSDQDRQQHPVGRVGVPEDMASLAAYLISAEARFITGANIVIDGGMTRKMIYAE